MLDKYRNSSSPHGMLLAMDKTSWLGLPSSLESPLGGNLRRRETTAFLYFAQCLAQCIPDVTGLLGTSDLQVITTKSNCL